MKKTILLFICVFQFSFSWSQTYRKLFDKLSQSMSSDNETNSFQSNFKSDLHNNESIIMCSYINMYKATKDIKYLNEFIIYAKREMDRRDEVIASAAPLTGLPANKGGCVEDQYSSLLPNTPCWSRIEKENVSIGYSCNLYPHWMETGTITFPMAEFILLTKENPDLLTEPLPSEILSTSLHNFSDFATYLEVNVDDALNFHIGNDWQTDIGRFQNHWSHTDAFNQQCAIGRSLILMYYISYLEGSPNNTYRDIIEEIAFKFYDHLHNDIGTQTLSDGREWFKWCHETDCQGSHGGGVGLREDISHAWLDVEFADLYSTYFRPASGYARFDEAHMINFANGMAYKVLYEPSKIKMNVYGEDCNCDQMCTACDGPDEDGNVYQPYERYFLSEAYCFLSKYDPEIYQAVSDFFTPDNINFNANYSPNYALLAYSNLALYEKLFNPIKAKRNTGTHHYWGAVSVDGNSQIIAVNNPTPSLSTVSSYSYDPSSMNLINTSNFSIGGNCKFLATGNLILSGGANQVITLDPSGFLVAMSKASGTITSLGSYTIANASNIRGLASGEFANSHSPEELVAVFDNGDLITYGNNSSLHTFPILYINHTGITNVAGITSGDFNGDGIAELAIMSNTSKKVSIFSLNNGSLTLLAETVPYANDPNWNGITSGDFDGDGTDEIMLHKDSDGAFEVYRYTASTSTISLKGSEQFPVNQGNGIMCKFHMDGYPQSQTLVTFRNFDGQISIFNLDGLCPGLDLSNQTIDASTSVNNSYESIDNNYPIDYHVNNTLVAGSGFTIASPSIVDMSSGKEIDFKDGFIASAGSDLHAYIASALECNPSTFRKPTVHNNNMSYTQYTPPSKTKPNNLITVVPNPNSGKFQIQVATNGAIEKIQEITVYDIRGTKVWETKNSSNITFDVDISDQPKGIYYVRVIDENGTIQVNKLINQ